MQCIVGIDVLDKMNDRCPLMNNISVSFTILSSVEIVHEVVDWEFSPIESRIRGNNLWKSKLFHELVVSFF